MLQFEWSYLYPITRATIIDRLIMITKEWTADEFINFMRAVNGSPVELPWHKNTLFREEIYKKLVTILNAISLDMNSSKKNTSSKAITSSNNHNHQNYQKITTNLLTSFLLSFAKIPLKYQDIPYSVHLSIYKNIQSILMKTDSMKDLSLLIFALSEMNWKWSYLPNDLQELFEITFLTLLSSNLHNNHHNNTNNNIISLCAFLKGCIGIDYHWYKHSELKEEIFQLILQLYGSRPSPPQQQSSDRGRGGSAVEGGGDTAGLVKIISSFGQIGLKKPNIPANVLNVLLAGVRTSLQSMNSHQKKKLVEG